MRLAVALSTRLLEMPTPSAKSLKNAGQWMLLPWAMMRRSAASLLVLLSEMPTHMCHRLYLTQVLHQPNQTQARHQPNPTR